MGEEPQLGKLILPVATADGALGPSIWQQVREHEGLIEADFQRFYGVDYRDVYRPGGGSSRLTLRRALSLASLLPPESLFKSELQGRFPISNETAALYDLWELWAGKKNPNWTLRQRQKDAVEHKAALRRARERARSHNAAYLARRKKKL